MALVAKVVLVLVTIVCLLSMGGAMFFAAPVLVPLHVLAARRSRSLTVGGWTFLAAASVFEFAWMGTYIATDAEGLSFAVGIAAALATIVVLLRDVVVRHELGVATPQIGH